MPSFTAKVEGKDWTLESRVIVALMRRMGQQEIILTPEDLEPPKGLVIMPKVSGYAHVVITD